MKALYFVSAIALVGGACGSDEDTNTAEQDVTAVQHISDEVNPPGTTGFYWLPPEVSTAPTTSGTFNSGYKLRLSVDILDMTCDTFTVTDSPAKYSFSSASVLVYTSIQTYRINTNVPAMALVSGHCYRVTPKLDGVALGFRDVMVTTGTPPTGLLKWGPSSNVVLAWGMYGTITPDACPSDPNKTDPGVCGCGVPDTDTDGDGTPDCNDGCPTDSTKTAPGVCGCGTPETGDTDADGALDCVDSCPTDPRFQTTTGVCGCNAYSVDMNEDGTPESCSTANSCTFI